VKPTLTSEDREGYYYCDREPFRRQVRFWPGQGDELWDGNCSEPLEDYTNFRPLVVADEMAALCRSEQRCEAAAICLGLSNQTPGKGKVE
jgi:hypothetical protein